MKLLICDDDISTIDLIQNHLDLKEMGITKLLRAYNGNVAKELIDSEKPEMMLCDIGMPLCNGLEVLEYVHNNKIPMVFTFLTCYESFEYARDAVRLGSFNYLTKPTDLNELYDCIIAMNNEAKERFGIKDEFEGMVPSERNVTKVVKDYMREHYNEEIRRDDMASLVYVTPNYLSKLFNEENGMSMREYLNDVRIEEAKKLILTTSMSISEIACSVGMDNISYFSTVFRKLCGCSPIEWKARRTK